MTNEDTLRVLRSVSFLAELDEYTLCELASKVREQRFAPHARIITELEFGADVYIVAKGEVEISVHSVSGNRQILGSFGPSATFGEMASLTGELRSASVRALTDVRVLVLTDRDFDQLRLRRPELAVALLRVLGQRLSEAEQTLKSLLAGKRVDNVAQVPTVQRSSLALLWRELVVSHEKDLAFLTLAGFVVTLLLVRLVVYLAFEFDFVPRDVLRAAYMSGFGIVIGSACAALLTFRPGWRRAIALAFGVGAALIINELGVTLAFDIFYKDIHTPDPSVAFDVERLYRRTEPARATLIGLLVLVQAVYLKAFYARVLYLIRIRLRRRSRSR